MQKIVFEDLPSTNTPISATNLNAMQTNAETEINSINTNIGTLSNLNTTDKTDLVSAINELAVDYVIETGSETVNSVTWKYTKWKSGKIELTGSASKTNMTISTASAGTYYGSAARLTLTLPFTLTSVAYIGVQETAPRSSGIWAYATTLSGTTLATEFRAFASINGNGSCGCSYHIIGTIATE